MAMKPDRLDRLKNAILQINRTLKSCMKQVNSDIENIKSHGYEICERNRQTAISIHDDSMSAIRRVKETLVYKAEMQDLEKVQKEVTSGLDRCTELVSEIKT